MLTLLFDEAATHFGQEYHPEEPARLINTEAYLLDKHPDWDWIKPRLASEEEVLRAHRPKHLERLRQPVDFDADTPYHPGIEEHARRAAGAAIGAVDLALRGEKAFALMRPPGHHATSTEAIGCERVAIWDFDAHHGNGTEEIVLGNRRIRFASIHQYPGYPGTGTISRGNVFNWPIPPHTDPEEHASTVRSALDQLLDFHPDILLVSAGFDAFAEDPLTEMTLQQKHFADFGRQLKATGLPAAGALEGGYSTELPILVETFLAAWSD